MKMEKKSQCLALVKSDPTKKWLVLWKGRKGFSIKREMGL